MSTKKKSKSQIQVGFDSKEAAADLGYTAATIERISDGEILTLNSDLETYSFSEKIINDGTKHKYTYERLMNDYRAKGKFRVLSWIKNMNVDTYVKFIDKGNELSK